MDDHEKFSNNEPLDPAVEAAISRAVERAVAAALSPKTSVPARTVVNAAEAMEMLGCGRTTIHRLIHAGKLKPIKFGSQNRFKTEELLTLLRVS